MHFQFYLFWPVLNFFVLALVLRNGGFAEVCLARKLKTPATTPILRGSKKLKYWCILTQKFQVNFYFVWSTFCCTLIIVISIVIIVVIIIIIIFICVWSTFWWGRRSQCPPRSGFPERQQCKPGWREPAEEKEVGSLIILIAPPRPHTHTKK